MKLIILSIILLLLQLTPVYSQWSVLNEGTAWNTVKFIDEHTGWLAASNFLLKTLDGGESWQRIPLPQDNHFEQIDFCSKSIIWAREQHGIYRSRNSGQSWELIREFPAPGEIRSFSALSDSIVYATGYNEVGDDADADRIYWILKTVNGGNNWVDVTPTTPIPKITFTSVRFFDRNLGAVSGYSHDDSLGFEDFGFEQHFFMTFDAGKRWKEIDIPGFKWIGNIQLNDKTIFYFTAADYEDKNFLCLSIDTLNSGIVLFQSPNNISSFFVDKTDKIYIVVSDSLICSEDGGKTWKMNDILSGTRFLCCEGPPPPFPAFVSFVFTNQIYISTEKMGFIIDGHSMFKSTDGGKTWYLHYKSYPFSDIYFINNHTGFVSGGRRSCGSGGHGGWIGSYGDMFVTHDGGRMWKHIFSDMKLKSIFFVDDQTGYALGNGCISLFPDKVFKTANAGADWDSVFNSRTYFNFDSTGNYFISEDLGFSSEQTGWVVGRAGINDTTAAAILATKDSGDNWDIVWQHPDHEEDINYSLTSICTIGQTAWAAGDYGMMVRYTPEDQWQLQSSVSDLPLNDVFFSDEDHGWIAGGYQNSQDFQSILLITRDAGKTWNQKGFDKYFINDICFSDNLHGWAVGQDKSSAGMILKTRDGGENWSPAIENLSAPLNAIHFKDGVGWAVGDNGLILTTDGITWINQKTGEIYPSQIELCQNYPNPFNPRTTISYTVKTFHGTSPQVNLSIYNLLGQKVATLVNKKQLAGSYTVKWNASGFASGIYYYMITAGDFRQEKKMVLLK